MTDLKQQLSFTLSKHNEQAYHRVVVYMVYATIARNKNITLKRLRTLLSSGYLIPEHAIDGVVASLYSKDMFNAINKFTPQGKGVDEMILTLPKSVPIDFGKWLADVKFSNPEVEVFVPPEFVYQQK